MPSTVRKGDSGSDVKLCQERLTVHGFPCSADGIFGSGTESKVIHFQQIHGLGADGIVGSKTWEALLAEPADAVEPDPPGPLPPVLVHLQSLGHKVVWKGDFHLNLFGIRSPNKTANSFDDILGCAYTEKGLWKVHYWPGTTDPGTYWLENPSRVEGTAILVEGQYLDTWMIDLHGGKYEALCQRGGEVSVYRDGDRDNVLDHDPSTIATGYFGINLHRSSNSGESTAVEKWSAGCQVHARLDGFNEMMTLARKQIEVTGIDTFTYTLMNQWW
jgi:peptidoglycan hydrolase-like protein with peptidoglycan-binding domain